MLVVVGVIIIIIIMIVVGVVVGVVVIGGCARFSARAQPSHAAPLCAAGSGIIFRKPERRREQCVWLAAAPI